MTRLEQIEANASAARRLLTPAQHDEVIDLSYYEPSVLMMGAPVAGDVTWTVRKSAGDHPWRWVVYLDGVEFCGVCARDEAIEFGCPADLVGGAS